MRLLFAILCLLAAGTVSPSRAESPPPPVVVELFTSQSCPLCPPAEDFMKDLAGREGVIALEFHIDYYDYTGWTDPFGRADHTRRWQNYARTLGARYEYTPLMVIDGVAHEIGSSRAAVEARIAERRTSPDRGSPRLTVDMREGAAAILVTGEGPAGIYDVMVATYDAQARTKVTAGENNGRTALNTNIVRGLERVAQWAGDPVEITVPLDPATGAGCVVLLQRAGGGPIIAAASVPLGG